jgi:hypothetical protein
MRGFHALFREKPSSLFMMLRWGSFSVVSLMMQSLHLYFMARILVSHGVAMKFEE